MFRLVVPVPIYVSIIMYSLRLFIVELPIIHMLVSPELLVSFTLLSFIALHLLVSEIAVGDPHTLAISEIEQQNLVKKCKQLVNNVLLVKQQETASGNT